MKKILLLCSAGMSTSMVVKKMEAAAAAENIEVKIDAVGLEQFHELLSQYDVFLLGPQVRFKKAELAAIAAEAGKPLDVIDTMAYGTLNGKKILDFALSLSK
ncbi:MULTISPECIES: PTS sugar transporter subunit IIB [Cetobacterium]|jgi:PTS system cellobiose-specific IIB component|uniref:PTS sugar transporter subunit IIB n=1 Tax=Candidatus Cetobacterium colombiensis TaxID=3073100 RepID=A0ABU4WBJ4_9FUSO|nr:PTS sugar transporter subunit IIB [Candidatus Cetobacterium colombiensis]MDX8335843.1 PTS sugar transporter subunit IIB [Candidatus Cetobacterium colombiensis]